MTNAEFNSVLAFIFPFPFSSCQLLESFAYDTSSLVFQRLDNNFYLLESTARCSY